MTHYTIDYEGLTAKQIQDKAIKDIQDYLGPKEYKRIYKALKKCGYIPSFNEFSMACWMLGIQGIPVRQFYNFCYPENKLPPVLAIVKEG